MDIPYFWHWVNPNPRSEIFLLENKQLLSTIKPSSEYDKYKSVAEIDRTPFLFLSDLFREKPKYGHPLCDTFSTFGWCSEREMAFVFLTDLMDFQGKVVAVGNHSWSELIVPLVSKTNDNQHFTVKIDNTFDKIEWQKIDVSKIKTWKTYFGDTSLSNWYNRKAHDNSEQQKMKKYAVSQKSFARIEDKICAYLNLSKN